MSYVHASSPALVHGDLKPSNILLFGNKFDLHGTPHYLGLRYNIATCVNIVLTQV
jgi:serine/threonine protein kinase